MVKRCSLNKSQNKLCKKISIIKSVGLVVVGRGNCTASAMQPINPAAILLLNGDEQLKTQRPPRRNRHKKICRMGIPQIS
jgi:hypothetical protein